MVYVWFRFYDIWCTILQMVTFYIWRRNIRLSFSGSLVLGTCMSSSLGGVQEVLTFSATDGVNTVTSTLTINIIDTVRVSALTWYISVKQTVYDHANNYVRRCK